MPAGLTLDLEVDDGDGTKNFLLRRASSTCSRCSASAKCRSASAAILPSRLPRHTVRAVGAVSDALARLGPATRSACAARSGWMADDRGGRARCRDRGRRARPRAVAPGALSVVCGRARYGKIVLLYGARSPDDILFRREIESWRRRLDIEIEVTVDHASSVWHGHVGVVTTLISRADFDPLHAIALVCGPRS